MRAFRGWNCAPNDLFYGPPGVGKTLLAHAMSGIVPDARVDEAIEITKIWSAAGMSPGMLMNERPFRAPHHSASVTALIGGGSDPKPGEISLAHRGILFLDELPEFQKNALEALRQPLEAGVVHIARTRGTVTMPAKFILVAAMNPCRCGYYGDPERECKCTPYEVLMYQKRISGPLLDRIDLQVKIGRVKIGELRQNEVSRKSAVSNGDLKERVGRVREIQARRFIHSGGKTNGEMTSREAEAMLMPDAQARRFLETLDKARLSPRGYYRLLKVARTIADLEEKQNTTADHLAEAYGYRIREEL